MRFVRNLAKGANLKAPRRRVRQQCRTHPPAYWCDRRSGLVKAAGARSGSARWVAVVPFTRQRGAGRLMLSMRVSLPSATSSRGSNQRARCRKRLDDDLWTRRGQRPV